jgi:hypothetical protein
MSYAELMCKWTAATITKQEYEDVRVSLYVIR